ncbi:MAG: cytochrome c family protein [Pseudomonadota bacterium]
MPFKPLFSLCLSTALWVAVVVGGASQAQAGDATAGQSVFKKCRACHVLDSDKNRVGPSLKDVVGRTAGAADGYKFSKAMVASGEDGLVWTEETLIQFLESPRKVVKGTKMAFPGLRKPEDRANVVAYISQFSTQ